MSYRIVRDDGIIIARGIENILTGMGECASLQRATGHRYSIADDSGKTIQIHARNAK